MENLVWLDERVARGYERWYEAAGRRADAREKALLGGYLDASPRVGTLLDVGCGTGHFTRWFAARGPWSVGLDASPAMLAEAVRRGTGILVRADASSLPFAGGAFDLVVLITTLEFVRDPARVLAEAVRVARRVVLLGALNRWSALAVRRRLRGGRVWRQARFFSTTGLRRLVRHAARGRLRGLEMRTALFPRGMEFAARFLPLGGFIGARVVLGDSGDPEEGEP